MCATTMTEKSNNQMEGQLRGQTDPKEVNMLSVPANKLHMQLVWSQTF